MGACRGSHQREDGSLPRPRSEPEDTPPPSLWVPVQHEELGPQPRSCRQWGRGDTPGSLLPVQFPDATARPRRHTRGHRCGDVSRALCSWKAAWAARPIAVGDGRLPTWGIAAKRRSGHCWRNLSK